MLFCCHRINTTKELRSIPEIHGIEIDLRDDQHGNIHLSHDPFIKGELFEDFLQYYKHSFIILNIKSERIEYKILDLLKKYNIEKYFFLDSSFPMIYKLSNEGEKNIAVRFSEFEDINTIINMKGLIDWVWIDCFTKNPLNKYNYKILKDAGFKLCFVSPELQNQQEKINKYKDYFYKNNIILDMICCKNYNIEKWKANNGVQVIIPMSGIGKRFIDAGYKEPKPLIEVDGKPIIEHVIELFPGESDFTFICNDKHLRETNMYSVLQNICPTSKIHDVSVENRQGPVHAVSLIYDNIDDDKEVIISYCDYGTSWNYDNFLLDTRNRNADGAIACYKGFHPHMLGKDNYAFLREKEEGSRFMDAIQEKQPFTNNRMNEYASNGTYYFKSGSIMKKYFSKLINNGIKVNNEYYVSMVYNLLVNDGLSVNIFEIDNMLQWGTPYDLENYKDWSKYFSNIIKEQPSFIDKHDTTLILPMAGAGSRFTQKNYKNPKPLIPVNGSPMIIQAVKCLPQTSQKIFICLEKHIEQYAIDKLLLDKYSNTIIEPINEITQGQACTCEIGINKHLVGEDNSILISACDNGVYYNTEKYQQILDDVSVDIIVWSFRNNCASNVNPNMYAWMEVDDDDYIKSVSCKNFDCLKHDIKKSHVIIGTFFFRKSKYFTYGLKELYEKNIRTNGEFYVDDVINVNIKQGLKIKVFEVDNYICWGTPDDYETYVYWQNFFNKNISHNYKIDKDFYSL